jgi:hypothetical protein
MWHTDFGEPTHEKPEIFHVTALIGRDGHRIRGLLDHGFDDLLDTPIMTKVNDLCASRLKQSPHDVDGGVVAVE